MSIVYRFRMNHESSSSNDANNTFINNHITELASFVDIIDTVQTIVEEQSTPVYVRHCFDLVCTYYCCRKCVSLAVNEVCKWLMHMNLISQSNGLTLWCREWFDRLSTMVHTNLRLIDARIGRASPQRVTHYCLFYYPLFFHCHAFLFTPYM